MPIDRNSVFSQPPDLSQKRVAVLGLARSGQACVRFLLGQGATVVGADRKGSDELSDAAHDLSSLGAQVVTDFEQFDQLGPVDLIVTSPGVPGDHPALTYGRSEGIEIVGELELAYWFCQAPIIAICGTNGKGSTTLMTGRILDAAGIDNLIAGNIGLPLISQIDRSGQVDVVVAEVSSFQLETIYHFRPWIAALLNITPDHLDRHESFAVYVAAKRRLFENQTAGDYDILCIDDPTVAQMQSVVPGHLLGVSTQVPYAAGRLVEDELVIDVPDEGAAGVCRLEDLPVRGRHNVANALVAALAGRLCGATVQQIGQGLKEFRPVDHLLQEVVRAGGITFIDDSKATNPAAAVADLSTLEGPLIVIAGGQGKGTDFSQFGQALSRRAKLVCLIGESQDDIAAAITDDTKTIKCTSLPAAVRKAYDAAVPGDQIVLLPGCASFDMFENLSQRGEVFTRLARGVVQDSSA